jgi:uncharacterized protein (TIGR02246 family)
MDEPSSAAADELAVRNLVARVAQFADGDDVEAYVALFTADAVWDMPGAPRQGHDDIRAGSVARRATGQIGPGSNSRHVITTTTVTVAGDRAEAVSYWLFYVETNAKPVLSSMGTYHDSCVRTGSGWKLAHRSIAFG